MINSFLLLSPFQLVGKRTRTLRSVYSFLSQATQTWKVGGVNAVLFCLFSVHLCVQVQMQPRLNETLTGKSGPVVKTVSTAWLATTSEQERRIWMTSPSSPVITANRTSSAWLTWQSTALTTVLQVHTHTHLLSSPVTFQSPFWYLRSQKKKKSEKCRVFYLYSRDVVYWSGVCDKMIEIIINSC